MTRKLKFGVLILSLLLLSLATQPSLAQTKESRSGRIRSAVVYYLAKFVRWEKSPRLKAGNSIKTCILGDDPLKDSIQKTVENKSAAGRKFEVSLFPSGTTTEDLSDCHLIFISKNSFPKESIERLTSAGHITVCAADTISWGPCIIQLFEENNKARLAIDNIRSEREQIYFSSQLLDVAVLRE